MTGDNVITLKEMLVSLSEEQKKGFKELRDMIADHDTRTVLVSYRTDQLEKDHRELQEKVINPLKIDVDDLKSTRKNYARVAAFIGGFITVVASAAGFIFQNIDAIAMVIK